MMSTYEQIKGLMMTFAWLERDTTREMLAAYRRHATPSAVQRLESSRKMIDAIAKGANQ